MPNWTTVEAVFPSWLPLAVLVDSEGWEPPRKSPRCTRKKWVPTWTDRSRQKCTRMFFLVGKKTQPFFDFSVRGLTVNRVVSSISSGYPRKSLWDRWVWGFLHGQLANGLLPWVQVSQGSYMFSSNFLMISNELRELYPSWAIQGAVCNQSSQKLGQHFFQKKRSVCFRWNWLFLIVFLFWFENIPPNCELFVIEDRKSVV